ncbi:aminoglycoside 6'-N-acetyltransferase [Adhaeribacter pallidiroseus]|uniref:Aminoglycoside N(6')-acetyltransferase type 1 n=1 Tax=Adhaeribacter pallidiroseus TaxID=2072847 RepID=A0A369QFY5_9BACT|nr:aminoglycoside 6'-N-acetyltransferase [Adhaeribacter pallidiroseus]RDC62177.1 Aminoglycoside 6'-N-acetyltransferase [Adhaeribacter pallidiroseus]
MHLAAKEFIITAQPEHLEELVTMGIDLWPDYTAADLRTTFRQILASEKFIVFLYSYQEAFVGFLYVGLRTDYVEGSESSPTGYVEGIYVKPAFRRQGISRQLLQAGEAWVKAKGCTQMGSDIYSNNTVSYDFHTRVGFQETARLITFIKDLN